MGDEKGTDLYRIVAPYFTVGIQVCRVMEEVVFAPPIVKYMKGWHLGEVDDYCWKKKWKLEKVDASS
jgi:hypothetical protein